MLKRYYKEMPCTWPNKLMLEIRNTSERSGIPYILDIEQVHEAIRSFKDKNAGRKFGSVDRVQVDNDVYRNHDLEKIKEKFFGLENTYDNSLYESER